MSLESKIYDSLNKQPEQMKNSLMAEEGRRSSQQHIKFHRRSNTSSDSQNSIRNKKLRKRASTGKEIEEKSSETSLACSKCNADSCHSFGNCSRCTPSSATSAMSLCSNCGDKGFLKLKLCKGCEKLSLDLRKKKSKANLPAMADRLSLMSTDGNSLCDSVDACSKCAGSTDDGASCQSVGVCKSCTRRAKEPMNSASALTLCNSMDVCQNCAGNSCTSIGVCKDCTHRANKDSAPSECNSMDVCRDCGGINDDGASCKSIGLCKNCTCRSEGKDSVVSECESVGVCSKCADGTSCKSIGICESCTKRAEGNDTECESVGVCSKCASSVCESVGACSKCADGTSCKSIGICASCTRQAKGTEIKGSVVSECESVGVCSKCADVTSCKSIGVCKDCTRRAEGFTDVGTSCTSIGVCKSCTRRAQNPLECDSMNDCNECAGGSTDNLECKSYLECNKCAAILKSDFAPPNSAHELAKPTIGMYRDEIVRSTDSDETRSNRRNVKRKNKTRRSQESMSTGSKYCPKYRKMRHQIERQNYLIEKMNQDLQLRTLNCCPEIDSNDLKHRLGLEVSKLNKMIEIAKFTQRSHQEELWGAIPITTIGDTVSIRIPRTPSGVTDVSGFGDLEEPNVRGKCLRNELDQLRVLRNLYQKRNFKAESGSSDSSGNHKKSSRQLEEELERVLTDMHSISINIRKLQNS